jgi:acylphosphatase
VAVVARRVLVSGRVQGVGYRDFARRAAVALGLCGWVRNLRDGRVEAFVEGDEDRVRAFLESCRAGPPAALVDRVAEEPAAPPGAPGFEVRGTA